MKVLTDFKINICLFVLLGRLSKNIEDLYILNDRKNKEFLLSPVIHI